MIYSAVLHSTLFHSYSPTLISNIVNLHISQANGPHARGVSSITQDWFAVANLFKKNPRLAKQFQEDPGLASFFGMLSLRNPVWAL